MKEKKESQWRRRIESCVPNVLTFIFLGIKWPNPLIGPFCTDVGGEREEFFGTFNKSFGQRASKG